MANRRLTSKVLRLKLANANLSIHGTRDVLEKRWTDYQKKQADQRQQMDGRRQLVTRSRQQKTSANHAAHAATSSQRRTVRIATN